jgi:hypothetical protein
MNKKKRKKKKLFKIDKEEIVELKKKYKIRG